MKSAYLLVHRREGSVASLLLARALLAGFLASTAMVVAFAVAFVVALLASRAPLGVLTDWLRGLTSNVLIDVARPNLYAATGVFFLGGLLWAALYAVAFEPRLHGSRWERGVQFAFLPWAFSLLVFLPLVGGGVLGLGLGAGPLPIVGNLILHVVYGATLGSTYVPESDSTGAASQLGAARGMLLGTALGIVAGGLATFAPGLTGVVALGQNPLGLMLAITLLGAGFGALAGSLSGAD